MALRSRATSALSVGALLAAFCSCDSGEPVTEPLVLEPPPPRDEIVGRERRSTSLAKVGV